MDKTKNIFFLSVVFLAFAISILIRIPNLNRPLSKHHEFNMAMVLNVCHSWDLKGGPSNVYFCPVIDYGNDGDLYFGPHSMLKGGKLYYASLGPLQFILPYYFCKLTALPFTPLSIQIFSLFVEAVTILLLYFLFIKIFNNHVRKKEISATGCVVFSFLPNILWFFANGYNHETLVLPFYIGVIYFFVKQIRTQNKLGISDFLYLMAFVILGILTDWLMVFIVFGYVLYTIILFVKERNRTVLLQTFFLSITTGIAIALIFYFYSKELGFQNFSNLFLEKFKARTVAGNTENTGLYTLIYLAFGNILISYLPLLICLFLLRFNKYGKRIWFRWHRLYFIFLIPPFLYTIVFLEFSAEHDYAFLKFSPALLVALFFGLQFVSLKIRRIYLTGTIIISILIYFFVNRPGDKGFNGDLYHTNELFGNFIRKNVLPEQFIYTNLAEDNLQAIIYYAKRNVRFYSTKEAALLHVKEFKIVNAVYITGNPDNIVIIKLS